MILFTIGHFLFGPFCHDDIPMLPFEQLPQAELVEQVLPPFFLPKNKLSNACTSGLRDVSKPLSATNNGT